jgi:hypothetical protein
VRQGALDTYDNFNIAMEGARGNLVTFLAVIPASRRRRSRFFRQGGRAGLGRVQTCGTRFNRMPGMDGGRPGFRGQGRQGGRPGFGVQHVSMGLQGRAGFGSGQVFLRFSESGGLFRVCRYGRCKPLRYPHDILSDQSNCLGTVAPSSSVTHQAASSAHHMEVNTTMPLQFP